MSLLRKNDMTYLLVLVISWKGLCMVSLNQCSLFICSHSEQPSTAASLSSTLETVLANIPRRRYLTSTPSGKKSAP